MQKIVLSIACIHSYKYMFDFPIKYIDYIISIHVTMSFIYYYAYHANFTKVLILCAFNVRPRLGMFDLIKMAKILAFNYF